MNTNREHKWCDHQWTVIVCLTFMVLTAPITVATSSSTTPTRQSKWSSAGRMHNVRIEHTASVLPNGKVLVVGGCNGSLLNDAELYDPTTRIWTVTRNMNYARGVHTASLLLNGKVLVTGGLNITANGNEIDSCDVTIATLRINDRRIHARSNRNVLINGGENMMSASNSAELYDPSTGMWTSTGSMNFARAGHTATVLTDGRVLVVGGLYAISLGTAELYDPSTGLWTNTSYLNYPRLYHKTVLLSDGKVLVTGGLFDDTRDNCELYNSITDLWKETGTFKSPRVSHELVGLPNGKVFITGGYSAASLNSSELYDSTMELWTGTRDMNSTRVTHTASLLTNDKVLATGGFDSNTKVILNTSEVYEISIQMWSTTDSMNTARAGHTASVLTNGHILVTGGYGQDFNYLDSAELYVQSTETLPVNNQTKNVARNRPGSVLAGKQVAVNSRRDNAKLNITTE